MKFVKERVNVICQELARLSISQKIKITDMQVKNGCYITPAEADASKEPWTSFDTVNDRWSGQTLLVPHHHHHSGELRWKKSLDESPCRTGRLG